MKGKNHKQFLRLNNIEQAKISSFKLSDEVLKKLGIGGDHKSAHDYFKEDLGIEEHTIFTENFNNYIHSTIPKETIATYKYCEIKGVEHDVNRVCTAFYVEGHSNLLLALNNFYTILMMTEFTKEMLTR